MCWRVRLRFLTHDGNYKSKIISVHNFLELWLCGLLLGILTLTILFFAIFFSRQPFFQHAPVLTGTGCHKRDRTQTSNRHLRVLTGPDTGLINTCSLSVVLAAAAKLFFVAFSFPHPSGHYYLPVVPGSLFGARGGPGCQTVNVLKTIDNALTVNMMMNDRILLSTWYLLENIGWILRALRGYMWPLAFWKTSTLCGQSKASYSRDGNGKN